MDYTARLPGHYKVRGGTRKWILRRAVAPWLPSGVLRRKKTGFSIPMKTWLRTDLRDLVEPLARGAMVRDHGLVEGAYVQRKVNEHLAGEADHAHRLWPLVMLESWVQNVLNGRPPGGRHST